MIDKQKAASTLAEYFEHWGQYLQARFDAEERPPVVLLSQKEHDAAAILIDDQDCAEFEAGGKSFRLFKNKGLLTLESKP